MSNSSTGIGFIGLLTIVFIVLKLTNYISWSWWWVLSPIWGSIALIILALCIFFIGYLIVSIIKEVFKGVK